MKFRFASVLFLIFAMSSCTTERVSTEFNLVNEVVQNTEKKLLPRLVPGINEANEAELNASAEAGDAWFLSDDCNLVVVGDVSVPATNCTVEKIIVGDRQVIQNEATAAKRKMSALSTYILSLSLLMDATLEEDVVTAYSSALTALTEFGQAAEISGLLRFLQKRSERSDGETAVVSEVIATLRYNRMKSVVLKSEKDIAEVTRELQLHLVNLNIDKDFRSRSNSLTEKNVAVLNYDVTTQGANGYKAAIRALQLEHKDFMKYYQDTLIYEVGMISLIHSALANALRSPKSPEEVVTYLESLQRLIEKVEG